jgi:hypothetical protein
MTNASNSADLVITASANGTATPGFAGATLAVTTGADTIATGVAAKLNGDTNGFGRFYQAFTNEGKVEIRAKNGTNVDTSKVKVEQNTAAAIATNSSTAVTLKVTTDIEAGATASIKIDGTTFTTAALSAGDDATAVATAFALRDTTGYNITSNAGEVTFTKKAGYVGGNAHSGGTTTDDKQSLIDTADRPAVTIGVAGGAVSATAVDTAGITLAAGLHSKVINERIGFEVSVSSKLTTQGALSVSTVAKAVDVFVDDTDVLSASAAMEAVRVVDDAVAMIGRERAGLGAFQNR